MTAIKNTPHAPTCNRCAHNTMGHCGLYIDEHTGSPAHVVEARRQCQGNEFEARANIANGLSGLVRSEPTTVTSDNPAYDQTKIYRDPWDKITKTYE